MPEWPARTSAEQSPGGKHGRPFYRRKLFLWPVGVILGLLLIALLAFRLSPRPGALIIRWQFDKNAGGLTEELARHEPTAGITVISDLQYRPDDGKSKLDAYIPDSARQSGQRLPVIVWTHGGAWLSGDKTDAAPYFKLLAHGGYTVIAPNYSLAPEHTYPRPVHQLNDVYGYIQENADRLFADPDKFILAGDSAGANLSAQMAAMITNPAYAAEVGVVPKLRPEQLKGVVLNCGIYMMDELVHPNPTPPKIVGWGIDVAVWAYSGTRDFSDPIVRQMSPHYYVTERFPATYITGGNDDPLTDAQSKPFADKLESLGVNVTRLFYPEDHTPRLPHEYQFRLDGADAQAALQATLSFAQQQTR